MKVLVAGWFSFDYGHATAGDLLARDVVCKWLDGAGIPYDSTFDSPFQGTIHRKNIDPEAYSHVVFVCGPFGRVAGEPEFLAQFPHATLIGLNLTMLLPLEGWNPFHFLFERDSTATVRPDIAFLSDQPPVPIVGLCLVEDYPQGLTAVANAAIEKLLRSRDIAVVPIDTRLDINSTGLRTPAQVESLLARMDAVVTTRLHGSVLSLKNGVPVLAIDPEAGGAKILKQMNTLKWPIVFTADDLPEARLQHALDYCLSADARDKARECTRRARELLSTLQGEFLQTVRSGRKSDAAEHTPVMSGEKGMTSSTLTRKCMNVGKRAVKAVARRTVPYRVRHWLRERRRNRIPHTPTPSPAAPVPLLPRQVRPVSQEWGYDRGQPVDRYYIENFLAAHEGDVRGRVLEIGDNYYTRLYGGGKVHISDVLHVQEGNPDATFVGDLTRADHLPSDAFDCVILTQTLQLIYDVPAALRTLHRILKPGGVLLATIPGITGTGDSNWTGSWYWSFTRHSASRLFGDVFSPENVRVEDHGNVLAASAFLYGLASHELSQEELHHKDPYYLVSITARAIKQSSK